MASQASSWTALQPGLLRSGLRSSRHGAHSMRFLASVQNIFYSVSASLPPVWLAASPTVISLWRLLQQWDRLTW